MTWCPKCGAAHLSTQVHSCEPLTPKDDYECKDCIGMTLRDWFAGQALSGILTGGFADTIPHDDPDGSRQAAEFAYQYADAMLKARLSPQESPDV